MADLKIEIEPFDYKLIKKHSFVVIVHPNPEISARIVTRILQQFKFHCGHIYTKNPIQYEQSFPYPCLPGDEAFDKLTQIWKKHGAHSNPILAQEDKNAISKLDKPSRRTYIKKLEPVSTLSRHLFGPSLWPEIYRDLNAHIMTPKGYLVWHHVLDTNEFQDGKWYKLPPVQQVFKEMEPRNHLLRIIVLHPSTLLHSSFYDACDVLMVFDQNAVTLKNLFRKAKLKSVFGTGDQFVQVQNSDPKKALVFAKVYDKPIDQDDWVNYCLSQCQLDDEPVCNRDNVQRSLFHTSNQFRLTKSTVPVFDLKPIVDRVLNKT